MHRTHSERADADRTCRFRRTGGPGFRLAFEITRRCDLSCGHCFVQRAREQPTGDEITDLIRQASRLGCSKLILTGGEPLVRHDLERIIAAGAEQGMLVDLNSNLYSLTRKRAMALRAAGLEEVSVSLYGGMRMHDELTQKDGSYSRTLKGIDVMREAGITVDVHGIISDGILPLLAGIVETACSHGASSITFFSLLQARKPGACRFSLCPEKAMRSIQRVRTTSKIPIRTVGLCPPEDPDCAMADEIYGIGADLRLRPCLLSRSAEAGVDVREHSLKDGIAFLKEQVNRGAWRIACHSRAGEDADG